MEYNFSLIWKTTNKHINFIYLAINIAFIGTIKPMMLYRIIILLMSKSPCWSHLNSISNQNFIKELFNYLVTVAKEHGSQHLYEVSIFNLVWNAIRDKQNSIYTYTQTYKLTATLDYSCPWIWTQLTVTKQTMRTIESISEKLDWDVSSYWITASEYMHSTIL